MVWAISDLMVDQGNFTGMLDYWRGLSEATTAEMNSRDAPATIALLRRALVRRRRPERPGISSR